MPPSRRHGLRARVLDPEETARLTRRGIRLEWATNLWNLLEVVVTVSLGIAARSLALVAFGLDSLIEVFASTVVIWHLRRPTGKAGRRASTALRLIAFAFYGLAIFLVVATARSLAVGNRPDGSPWGIAYLAFTGTAMFTLAALKHRTSLALDSDPLHAEATMTFLDGWLCVGILVALALNLVFGLWWTDAVATLVIAALAWREGRTSTAEAAEIELEASGT